MLGKELGPEILARQMQYDADYKKKEKKKKKKKKNNQKINASHTLEGTVLYNVEKIKYLGITITNDLKWNKHVSNNCTKASKTLGFL